MHVLNEWSRNNIYGYVASCFNEGPWLAFYNNTCITTGEGFSCPRTATMTVEDNKVYSKDGKAKACKGGSVGVWPSDASIKTMADQMVPV